jgi:helicase
VECSTDNRVVGSSNLLGPIPIICLAGIIMTKQQPPHIMLALDTLSINKQALIFFSTRRSAEKGAEDIAKLLKKNDAMITEKEEHKKISKEILKTYSTPTRQCERLAFCASHGVAFHHSGLPGKQRHIIEDEFRNNTVRIICCTPTLAAGVDLPSFRTILKDIKRYGHRGMDYIPVLEYLQMAGRSGRPSYDSYGECFLIAQTEGEMNNLKDRYIDGEPEEIYSKLAAEPALRSHILSLIVQGYASSEEETMRFIMKSFYGYQFKDERRILIIVRRIIGFLEEHGFILSSKPTQENDAYDLFSSAYDILDGAKIKATLLGTRISELYLDPLTASTIIRYVRSSSIIGSSWFAKIHLLSQALELRPLPSIKKNDYETIEKTLNEHTLIVEENVLEGEYDIFLKTIKIAAIMESWTKEEDEHGMMEKYDITPGELHAKLEIYDWLCYSSSEICRILEKRDEQTEFQKLRMMLKNGVGPELIGLVRIRGIGRKRARILYNNGIMTRTDIIRADISKLSSLIGEKTARSIKQMSFENRNAMPKDSQEKLR